MNYKNRWNGARERLKIAMKGEVSMMREILSNLNQEELSLRANDKKSWDELMIRRNFMVQKLGNLRQERMVATEELEHLTSPLKKDKREVMDQILSLDDEAYSEILLLRDQCLALMERINFQNHFNHDLFQQIEKHLDTPSYHHHLELQAPAPQLKKNRVATYDINSND